MKRLVRMAWSLVVLVGAMGHHVVAAALPLTVDLPDGECWEATMTGSPAAGYVIQCTPPASVPACTLSAAPSSVTGAVPVILTATCSPAASSYAWGGPGTVGCGMNMSSCGVITPASGGSITYTVTAANGRGVGATAQTVISVVATGAMQPTNCSIWPAISSLGRGQSQTFTVNCNHLLGSTTYTWGALGGNATPASTNNNTFTTQFTTVGEASVTVQVCNGAGSPCEATTRRLVVN